MLATMLKEAVASRGKIPQPDREPGISCSALFPCPYRLYLVHTGQYWDEELSGPEIMNLEDGWDQEEQSVRRLKEELGVTVKNRQAKVSVGKSCIPGQIDGEVNVGGVMLWEHKAWASYRFEAFRSRGLEWFQGERCQANAYMLGRGLDKCEFFVKKKEHNDYHSIIVPLERNFILPVIEWADKIRMEGWVPKPKEISLCTHCGVGCFGEIIDFSALKTASAAEIVEKWITGDKYVKVGEMLKDEARFVLTGQVKRGDRYIREEPGLIGDKDILIVEGLKVLKVPSHRFDVDKGLVIRHFGPEGLMKVGREKDIISFRIQEVS